jgi:exosortase A
MQLNPPLGIIQEAPRRLGAPTLALLAIAFLAPLVFYFDTARSIVEIWHRSETFAHGYIILPICIWLIWRRRANFSLMPPTPYWPALGLLALAGFGWVGGRVAEVQVVQQYALAMMLPLTALAVFGRRLAGSLAFPLLFVLAAVPAGEIFIGPLISVTADFTVWALQLIGMPVLRNGTVFEIPTGTWSVVEACSGVRYLISSVTLGLLYAYLTYRSNVRRALFVATAVVVPIVANGLRAFMIVMIGHLSGMKLAVGVDHIIYGWLFFGLVMFLMFWIGSFWREDEQVAGPAAPAQPEVPVVPAAGASATARLAAMTAMLVALAALWPVLAAYNARVTHNPAPVQFGPVNVSWSAAPAFSGWLPDYMPADAAFNGVYRAGAAPAQPVALTVLYYRNQTSGKALVSSVNVVGNQRQLWHLAGSDSRSVQLAGGPFELREARLQGPTGKMLVWHWKWIDNRFTANDYLGKLWQAQAKLMFRGDDGAAVMLSAPYDENPDVARDSMRAFLNANLAPIEAALAAARAR